MRVLFEIFDSWLGGRADVAIALVATAGACIAAHVHVRRQIVGAKLPATVYLGIAITFGAAALLAELVATQPEAGDVAMISLLRMTMLLGGMAVAGGWLVLASRVAVLEADLRQRVDIERELQHAKTSADEANRAKSDFLAMMSHEMRTPLNAVTGFATLLRDTRLDEAQRDYVRTITGEAARLSSLINDVLDLTKIEEGRLNLERMPFAPVETAHEVLRLLQSRASDQRLDLRFEAQIAGPLLIAGDPLRFRQVLLNLLDNAIKFTPVGSVTLFLTWRPPPAEGGTGQLAVRVKDTGIGIAEEKLRKLFQMFVQADTSTTRRYGGTGLGLAISQRLVRMMGGEITATSKPGVGSEFAFVLPMTSVSPPGETETDEIAPLANTQRRPRVLVVDDMETNRFLLEVFLRRNGFEPELAAGGEEAIRLASANRYDVILMDLHMPDIDGYTAVRKIREDESGHHHTPIIALTASIAKGTREKCLAAGMDEHMTKPLDLRRFRQLLDRLVAPPQEARAPAVHEPHIPVSYA